MDSISKILIKGVPSNMESKTLHQCIEEIVGPNSIQTTQDLSLQRDPQKPSQKKNVALILKSPEHAQKIVARSPITIEGSSYVVELYRPREVVQTAYDCIVIVKGFEGTNEDLKKLLEKIGGVSKIELGNDSTSRLVTFSNKDQANNAVAQAKDLGYEKELTITLCTQEAYTSLTSSTSTRPSATSEYLQAGPKSIVIKGKSLSLLDEAAIQLMCKPYDENVTIKLRHKSTSPTSYVAFIGFSSEEGAKKMIDELNRKPIPESVLAQTSSESSAQNPEFESLKSEPIIVEYVTNRKLPNDRDSFSRPQSFSQNFQRSPSDAPVSLFVTFNRTGESESSIIKLIEHQAKVKVLTCSYREPEGTRQYHTAIVTLKTTKDAETVMKAFAPDAGLPSFLALNIKPYRTKEERERASESSVPVAGSGMPGGNPPYPPFQMPGFPPEGYFPGTGIFPYPPMRPNVPQMPYGYPPMGNIPRYAQPQERRPQPGAFHYQPNQVDPNQAVRSRVPQQVGPRASQPILPNTPAIQPPLQPAAPLLNLEDLEHRPEAERREIIGEFIYNRAKQRHGESSAPRIAGMLLEFQFSELKPTLKDMNLLDRNIDEAYKML